jgi:hypothetical protein
MIHYSVVPMEVIFAGMEEFAPKYVDLRMDGYEMQVEPINDQQARIVRLNSMNPQDYLNPRLAPGTIIEYGPRL